jgi:hypothetical protein
MWEQIRYNLGGKKVRTEEEKKTLHQLVSEVKEVYICEHERECDHLWLVIFMVK